MVAAALPDLNKPALLFFGKSPFPEGVDRFHARIQRESQGRMPQELVVGATLATVLRVSLFGSHRLSLT